MQKIIWKFLKKHLSVKSVSRLVNYSVNRLVVFLSPPLPVFPFIYKTQEEIATLRSQQRIATLPTVVRKDTPDVKDLTDQTDITNFLVLPIFINQINRVLIL